MKKYLKFCVLFFVLLLAIVINLISVNIVTAADGGIIPRERYAKGNYQLNDIISVAVNVANFILSIVGSLSLVMFIYGGITFLISGGSSTQVEKGKQIILGAIIGLVLVFTSYSIIKLACTALGVTTIENKLNIQLPQ
ncbi:hypothetical protein KKF17_01395 [Patescibacteria group bacterium]|nr:hypothetical protein [Patescibacteria group bacterium]